MIFYILFEKTNLTIQEFKVFIAFIFLDCPFEEQEMLLYCN